MLALARRRRGLRSPTNWHSSRHGLLAADGDAAEELASWALEAGGRRLRLAFVDPSDPTLPAVAAAVGRGPGLVTRPMPSPPYIRLEGSWEAWERGLDPDMRRELRRRRRRLEELGSIAVEVHDGEEGLERLLREGFAVEAAGWKDARGTAIVSRPETERFYRRIAEWGARAGLLRLAFLRLDGRPLAFDFALETRASHFLLKTGFDPEWRRYAPGQLLRREMLARAFGSDLESYEFLGAPDPWKLEWTRTCRDRVELAVFPRTPAGAAARVLEVHLLPAARRVRDRLRR